MRNILLIPKSIVMKTIFYIEKKIKTLIHNRYSPENVGSNRYMYYNIVYKKQYIAYV